MSCSLLERSPIRWYSWMTESSSNEADRKKYSSTQKPTGLVSSSPDSSATAKRNSGRAPSHSSESERAECSLSRGAKLHVLMENLNGRNLCATMRKCTLPQHTVSDNGALLIVTSAGASLPVIGIFRVHRGSWP